MKLPRAKFTVGRLMLAVAFFSVGLHVGLSYRRSGEYGRAARFHARAAEMAVIRARDVGSGEANLHGYTDEEKLRVVDQARRFAAYSGRMKTKFEWAALFPWLPVAPDPPTPVERHGGAPESSPAAGPTRTVRDEEGRDVCGGAES